MSVFKDTIIQYCFKAWNQGVYQSIVPLGVIDFWCKILFQFNHIKLLISLQSHVVTMYEHTLSPDEKSKLPIKQTVHYVLNQFSFVRNAQRRHRRQGTGGRVGVGRKHTVAGSTFHHWLSPFNPILSEMTKCFKSRDPTCSYCCKFFIPTLILTSTHTFHKFVLI